MVWVSVHAHMSIHHHGLLFIPVSIHRVSWVAVHLCMAWATLHPVSVHGIDCCSHHVCSWTRFAIHTAWYGLLVSIHGQLFIHQCPCMAALHLSAHSHPCLCTAPHMCQHWCAWKWCFLTAACQLRKCAAAAYWQWSCQCLSFLQWLSHPFCWWFWMLSWLQSWYCVVGGCSAANHLFKADITLYLCPQLQMMNKVCTSIGNHCGNRVNGNGELQHSMDVTNVLLHSKWPDSWISLQVLHLHWIHHSIDWGFFQVTCQHTWSLATRACWEDPGNEALPSSV